MTTRKAHLTVKEVLRDIVTPFRVFEGDRISMHSQRYKLFRHKGVKCVACPTKGTHFRIERHGRKGRFHLNLYSDDGTMMTKDHIKAKSKGGKDKLSNYQPMCEDCNKAKGSR